MEDPDNIQGNVIAAEPTRLQDTIRIANNLMDQKLKGYVMKNVENKRRLKVNHRDNRGQQPPFKRPNVGGHYKSDCIKMKDQNRGNKMGNKNGVGKARGKAYVLGGGDANPDSNVVEGCRNFMAQITKKETEDKSKEKQLEDVPIVRDFPEVFPEDLPRLPPTRQLKFQIKLVPGAEPVARALYRLASLELQELSTQLQELSDKGFIRPSSSP
ncbi:hypothetical protein Tco_0083877 [Tanacetum coccineum]